MQVLINKIAQAGITVALCRSQLAGQMHRLRVARNDVEYYQRKSNEALENYGNATDALGNAWLALMNSGISHRRYLKVVMAVEGA